MSGLSTGWSYLTSWFRRDPATAANGRGNGEALPARQQAASRDRAIAQLQGAYEEVVGLMSSIQQHMQAQSDRSERLLAMMEGLPEALKSLPEAQRNQTRTLEAIQGHLAEQSRHTAGLTQAIQGLAQAADTHERSMNIIQQQLDASQHNGEQILSSFSSLSETLGRMTDSSQAGTAVLQRLAERSEQSDDQVRRLFTRSQRQFTIMSVVSWALAILALGVAGLVAYAVAQQSFALAPAPTPATTATATTTPAPASAEAAGGGPASEPGGAAAAGIGLADARSLTGVPADGEQEPEAAPIGDQADGEGERAEWVHQPIFGQSSLADLNDWLSQARQDVGDEGAITLDAPRSAD